MPITKICNWYLTYPWLSMILKKLKLAKQRIVLFISMDDDISHQQIVVIDIHYINYYIQLYLNKETKYVKYVNIVGSSCGK